MVKPHTNTGVVYTQPQLPNKAPESIQAKLRLPKVRLLNYYRGEMYGDGEPHLNFEKSTVRRLRSQNLHFRHHAS